MQIKTADKNKIKHKAMAQKYDLKIKQKLSHNKNRWFLTETSDMGGNRTHKHNFLPQFFVDGAHLLQFIHLNFKVNTVFFNTV